MASHREHLTPLHRQRGISMVFIGAGMMALLLMVGLALDAGHATLNKARLQNATDAAALHAALGLAQMLRSHGDDLVLVAAVVAGVLAVLEVLKRLWRAYLVA